MPYKHLLVHDEAGILTLTLHRPDRRNALNHGLITELIEAFSSAAERTSGIVLLTGSGSAFCAGLDLEQLQSLAGQTKEQHFADSAHIARLFRALYDLPLPTIAAVNGAAIAGGTGLATLCDFTLAVPEAKFGYTEARIGFVPAIVSSFLILQIGEKRARDLLLTARIFTAAEAHALGLVNEILPADQLMPRAIQLAQSLLQNSPESLRSTKQLLSSFTRARLDAELSSAAEWNAAARTTGDFFEGIAAFLEKRPPVWPSLNTKPRPLPGE